MNSTTNPDNLQHLTAALLAPLLSLITALDEADLHHEDLPLAMPGLLKSFLDPEVQAALPAGLRAVADVYLEGLPGYRDGDLRRAALQHELRLALWDGEACPIEDTDIEAMGWEEQDDG
ncbi:hypothetical protein [Candidatus Competibacter phosphatis]|uniref:hypothetical protein n=1 Tax=Candidatus Competibacter phosphatis TaxID=221280 RepID=UPI00145DCF22|nr:hypothetical protein [Candidatus Competibacter phosphatis]